jgi:hypothetical protein
MPSPQIKARTEKATVRFMRRNRRRPVAQGVLVPGGFILTAAHCINWSRTGAMALGDHYIETMASDGVTYKIGPFAVEPVMDIAALGATYSSKVLGAGQFEMLCEAIEPVPVSSSRNTSSRSCPDARQGMGGRPCLSL